MLEYQTLQYFLNAVNQLNRANTCNVSNMFDAWRGGVVRVCAPIKAEQKGN